MVVEFLSVETSKRVVLLTWIEDNVKVIVTSPCPHEYVTAPTRVAEAKTLDDSPTPPPSRVSFRSLTRKSPFSVKL